MALVVKQHESLDPVDIARFGAPGVMVTPDSVADLVQEFPGAFFKFFVLTWETICRILVNDKCGTKAYVTWYLTWGIIRQKRRRINSFLGQTRL